MSARPSCVLTLADGTDASAMHAERGALKANTVLTYRLQAHGSVTKVTPSRYDEASCKPPLLHCVRNVLSGQHAFGAILLAEDACVLDALQ